MLGQRFWERYFRVYDTLNFVSPYQQLLEAICGELGIKKGDRVLEAGCGTGNLALKIRDKGGEVVGLDNSRPALDIYIKKNPEANAVFADIQERLPFADGYFDKVVSNNTLYLLSKEARRRALSEFYRVLKPGGKVVISDPGVGSNAHRIYLAAIRGEVKKQGILAAVFKVFKMLIPTMKILYYNLIIRKEYGYQFFESGEQEELLKSAGFSDVSEAKAVYAGQSSLISGEKLGGGNVNEI